MQASAIITASTIWLYHCSWTGQPLETSSQTLQRTGIFEKKVSAGTTRMTKLYRSLWKQWENKFVPWCTMTTENKRHIKGKLESCSAHLWQSWIICPVSWPLDHTLYSINNIKVLKNPGVLVTTNTLFVAEERQSLIKTRKSSPHKSPCLYLEMC